MVALVGVRLVWRCGANRTIAVDDDHSVARGRIGRGPPGVLTFSAFGRAELVDEASRRRNRAGSDVFQRHRQATLRLVPKDQGVGHGGRPSHPQRRDVNRYHIASIDRWTEDAA